MRTFLLASVIALGWFGVAKATPITAAYDFKATFSSGPNAIISGAVSLTYDPLTKEQVTVNDFASQVLGGYTPIKAFEDATGLFTIGTNPTYSNIMITQGTNSFGFFVSLNATGDVTESTILIYSPNGANTNYMSNSLTVVREATSVPEPASIALLGAGVVSIASLRLGRTVLRVRRAI